MSDKQPINKYIYALNNLVGMDVGYLGDSDENVNTIVELIGRVAELEDMIEQGLLIKLPCKVGDTVYWVFTLQFDEEYEVYRGKVRRITVDTHEVWVQVSTRYGAAFERTIDEIGKTLFLTKAEAEVKLEELKRGQK